jgi:hypothetical protein
MLDTVKLMLAGFSIFLIGANTAFLANFGSSLVSWFRLKVTAVSGLLLYVALSGLYGDPAPWRLTLGLVAVFMDMAAIVTMWSTIDTARKQNIIGLVPLLRDERKEWSGN